MDVTTIALDLEGTLISNAVSQFPRKGLYEFVEFCGSNFESVVFYTAVGDEIACEVVSGLAAEGLMPGWSPGLPFVQIQVRPFSAPYQDDNELARITNLIQDWTS